MRSIPLSGNQVASRRFTTGNLVLLGATFVLATCCQPWSLTHASVFSVGDIFPADNPFTLTVNEGLPVDGNFIDPFDPVDQQEDFERNVNVVVGNYAFGSVLITGGSALRYDDLVIGSIGNSPVNGAETVGTGVVRITGFGSLYNNDPTIIPAGLPSNFGSVNPRDPMAGYDMYIGREGNGTLQIENGGRAEIQDAIVIGEEESASGTLVVDGLDSFLQSGGFEAPSGGIDSEPHLFYIGRSGSGFAQVTNGAQILSRAAAGGASNLDVVSAVIGGEINVGTTTRPMAGGFGMMTVDGFGSKWLLDSGLQIGGYHEPDSSPYDSEGDDVEYNSDVGVGTLTVSNEGTVSLYRPTDYDGRVQLLIGRFGRLELDNGLLEVGNPLARDKNENMSDLISNDGVIRGGGRIETGVFRNRFYGEVRIGQDQSLLIDSTSEFEGPGDAEPLDNWGLIEVLGGELEVSRTPAPSTSGTVEVVAPFQNNRLTVPPLTGGRDAGLIVSQSGVLRFGTGMLNEGTMAFTAGVDNIVSGDVNNEPESMPGMGDEGLIAIAGHETFVTFENDLVNAGKIDVSPDATGFTVLGDFDNSMGTLSLTLGGGESGQEFSHIVVGETATLGGELQVSLFSSGANPLSPMAGDAFEILSANGSLVGDFASFLLPNLTDPTLGWLPLPDPVAGTYTLFVLGVPPAAIGADFNGDGVVDSTDYTIWLANLGNPGGLGDANGDGRVDGLDFLIWQDQLGGAGMVPGAGAGSSLGTVPEPTSGMLLACGLFGWITMGRRKTVLLA